MATDDNEHMELEDTESGGIVSFSQPNYFTHNSGLWEKMLAAAGDTSFDTLPHRHDSALHGVLLTPTEFAKDFQQDRRAIHAGNCSSALIHSVITDTCPMDKLPAMTMLDQALVRRWATSAIKQGKIPPNPLAKANRWYAEVMNIDVSNSAVCIRRSSEEPLSGPLLESPLLGLARNLQILARKAHQPSTLVEYARMLHYVYSSLA